MSIKDTFVRLVEEAFDISADTTVKGLAEEVARISEEIKGKIQKEAEEVWRKSSGPKIDAYLEDIRNHDYRSEIINRLMAKAQAPQLEPEQTSHVSLSSQIEKARGIFRRYEIVTPNELSIELGVVRTTVYAYLNPLLESGEIERVGGKGSKGIKYRLMPKKEEGKRIEYKPDASYNNIWSKFLNTARGRDEGVTPLDILQSIIDDEKSQGKVPNGADLDAITQRYQLVIRLVLGKLVQAGKGLEKADGRWKIKQYTEPLTPEDVDYIITRTLEVAEELELGGLYRWKASDVWPEHPDKVERFYEQKLNGQTVRGYEGIGMMLIANPQTKRDEAVYYWQEGKGDFSQTKPTVYKIIGGNVVETDEDVRQIRETFGDTTGKYRTK